MRFKDIAKEKAALKKTYRKAKPTFSLESINPQTLISTGISMSKFFLKRKKKKEKTYSKAEVMELIDSIRKPSRALKTTKPLKKKVITFSILFTLVTIVSLLTTIIIKKKMKKSKELIK